MKRLQRDMIALEILADRIQHDRRAKFRDDFAHDVVDSASSRLRCAGRSFDI